MKQKVTEWKLEDYVRSREDLVNLMWATLDDIDTEDVADKDFEFFIHACLDVITIAKQKGWIKYEPKVPKPVYYR